MLALLFASGVALASDWSVSVATVKGATADRLYDAALRWVARSAARGCESVTADRQAHLLAMRCDTDFRGRQPFACGVVRIVVEIEASDERLRVRFGDVWHDARVGACGSFYSWTLDLGAVTDTDEAPRIGSFPHALVDRAWQDVRVHVDEFVAGSKADLTSLLDGPGR